MYPCMQGEMPPPPPRPPRDRPDNRVSAAVWVTVAPPLDDAPAGTSAFRLLPVGLGDTPPPGAFQVFFKDNAIQTLDEVMTMNP